MQTGLGFEPVTTAAAISAISKIVGGRLGGAAVDQQRRDRAAYFLAQAQNGNVAAAQLLLGGLNETASHEQPFYQAAIEALQAGGGSDTLQQARDAGPYWSASDTATNYPTARAYINSWAQTNQPIQTAARRAADAVGGAVSSAGGLSPVVIGGAVLAALLLSRRRRS